MAKQGIKLTAAVIAAVFLVVLVVGLSYCVISDQGLPIVSPDRSYYTIHTSVPLTRIIINSDGSITPSNAGVAKNGNIYLLTGTVNSCTIEVQKDDIVLDGAGHSFIASLGEGTDFGEQGIIFNDRNNITIRNFVFEKYLNCIVASNSSYIIIDHNTIDGCSVGLLFDNCNYTTISDNALNDVSQAILINSQKHVQSINCTIARNVVTNAASGVAIFSGLFNEVNDNTFWYVDNSIWFSSNFTVISGNKLHNGIDGISVGGKYSINDKNCSGGSYSTIKGNYVDNFTQTGISFNIGINNTIFENTVANCKYGVAMGINGNPDGSWIVEDNIFYHNNFVNNLQDVLANSNSINYWDNGCEGNFWDKLTIVDNNGDCVNDRSYNITGNSFDRYPLINHFGDLGFDSTLASQTFVEYVLIILFVAITSMILGAFYFKKRVKL